MPKPNIYEDHDKTFSYVSAFVVCKDGARVATVAFSFARSGLRVTAFVHWIGCEMVKGIARGGGYDRKTAACAHAVSKTCKPIPHPNTDMDAFVAALAKDQGPTWDAQLHRAGFTVLQAV